MGRHFAELAFTPAVQREQARIGSRSAMARMQVQGRDDAVFTDAEAGFVAARDSFYVATVSETGWPYVQHRGGPPGFARVLDTTTLGWADLGGNRQHISVGNLAGDARASLFFMDYGARRRLKVLGHLRVVEAADDPALVAALAPAGAPAGTPGQRAMLLTLAGYDWNCPQHITPRWTAAELLPVAQRLQAAEAEVAALREALGLRRPGAAA